MYMYATVFLLGRASRKCLRNKQWDDFINVTLCRNVELINLYHRVKMLENSLDSRSSINITNEVLNISEELLNIITRSGLIIFPNDLNITIEIIDAITRLRTYCMYKFFLLYACNCVCAYVAITYMNVYRHVCSTT